MKKIAFLLIFSLVIITCTNQKKDNSQAQSEEVTVLTVDSLYANAENLIDKEVVIKGTVMHVCKEGGVRCFLMGSNEDILVRVEAGEDIGAFTQEQMGSELEIVGILKEVKTETDAHNPMHDGEAAEDSDKTMEPAHEAIAKAQETEEVQYFILGKKAKEIKAAPVTEPKTDSE